MLLLSLQEFLLAIDVTSSGTPEEKLKWAFRMYDVDGNGVIDIQEMTKIVQVYRFRIMYFILTKKLGHKLMFKDQDTLSGCFLSKFQYVISCNAIDTYVRKLQRKSHLKLIFFFFFMLTFIPIFMTKDKRVYM